MAGDRKELILVDGSGYIFRAFFALPQLTTSRGMPTNAVYGFIRMLLKLLKDTRPTHIAVVFDSAKKTFRDDLFEDYKANRAEMPSDLSVQIPYVHRAVEAFRIKSIIRDGYEADDVIATLATRAARKNFDTIIVTSDKDLRQLVGPHVTLWDTMSDRRTGVREVRERFGVEPDALADIQALTGDPIDNVKGVPGIGEKTASALVQRFGGIAKLFANLGEVEKSDLRGAKKIADLLRQHRADAELALKLVRIDTGVPLDVEPDDLAWEGIDSQAAADLVRELEFHSLLAELTASAAAREARAGAEVAVRRDDLPAVIDELGAAERISLDLAGEDGAGDRLQLRGGGLTYVVTGDLIGDCASLLGSPSPPRTCHDLKTHLRRLGRHGVTLRGVDFDTMLAGFLVNPGRAEPSLDDLYHEHLAPVGGGAAGGT
ncbi:MAG TPA: 5'-3' exonuclease H3TH domain-containing protein, partial [Candidatus Binataceae bacterium]|nr:5'-3' exonuclease H3TH domain-containing protein [Candidatus Binataceae bacterium]